MPDSRNLLEEVCSIPTAPFAEKFVVRYIERFVAARKKLRLSRDSSGNLLIELVQSSRSRSSRRPRWIFAAHMDHPGFVARRMIDSRTLEAAFYGWVQIDYVRGTKVRFFADSGSEISGTVIEATPGTHDKLTVPSRVKVRLNRPTEVAPGSPGMFDLGAGRAEGKRFLSRGIDDQGGLASALAMLDQLHQKPPGASIAVLLTRAEEEGFIGAMAAVLKPKLLRKSDRIIAIECSAMQPYARQGDGVIIRIGDKTSIFNSSLSYFLTQQATELAKKDKTFKYQRALMPGGTCEATVYDAYGYTAAAVCIPLGNYHNMDREKKRIAAEYIDIADWTNMVKLFVQVARNAEKFDPANSALKRRVTERYERVVHLL